MSKFKKAIRKNNSNRLMDKIRENSTIPESSILSKSKFFNERDMVQTSIPIINIALSGRLDGGLTPGVTMWAGPSKNFKTAFSLLMAKSYLDKYPESIMLFYDSEFGTPKAYFDVFKIDPERVYHAPITDIEKLKFDLMQQLNELKRGDKIIIVIDSMGSLASVKEVEDALDKKSVADMTRAKQFKSLFRMITPHLILKDISLIVVNHTYKTQELYSRNVVGGGTGSYYSADNIFILGREQDKDGKELKGFNFIINVEKSRYVKEKSKIPVSVSFKTGISKWSGLLELAQESGHVKNVSRGNYSRVNVETGEIETATFAEEETNTKTFWNYILSSESFQKFIKDKYMVSGNDIISDDEVTIYDEKLRKKFNNNDDKVVSDGE